MVVVEEERPAPPPTRSPSEDFEATSEPIFMTSKTPHTLSRVGVVVGVGVVLVGVVVVLVGGVRVRLI